MQVRVFGILATTLGTSTVELDAVPATTTALLAKIAADHPDVAVFLEKQKIAVAVNHEFAKPDAPIREGDEVALMPPVSGG